VADQGPVIRGPCLAPALSIANEQHNSSLSSALLCQRMLLWAVASICLQVLFPLILTVVNTHVVDLSHLAHCEQQTVFLVSDVFKTVENMQHWNLIALDLLTLTIKNHVLPTNIFWRSWFCEGLWSTPVLCFVLLDGKSGAGLWFLVCELLLRWRYNLNMIGQEC